MLNMETTTRKMLTVDELAAMNGVHRSRIYRWIHDGIYGVRLRARSMGRKIGFRPEDVEAFWKLVDTRRGFRK